MVGIAAASGLAYAVYQLGNPTLPVGRALGIVFNTMN
jgi:hypothetical protein